MKVADVMTRDVATVNIEDNCEAPARVMWDRDVGGVPVVDAAGGLVGIVTDRDLVMCALRHRQRLDEMPVKLAMTGDVISAREDDDVERVELLMQRNQVRRIPILDDDGLLAGIVAVADLAKLRGAAEDVSDEAIAKTVDAVSQPHATIG